MFAGHSSDSESGSGEAMPPHPMPPLPPVALQPIVSGYSSDSESGFGDALAMPPVPPLPPVAIQPGANAKAVAKPKAQAAASGWSALDDERRSLAKERKREYDRTWHRQNRVITKCQRHLKRIGFTSTQSSSSINGANLISSSSSHGFFSYYGISFLNFIYYYSGPWVLIQRKLG